MNDEVREREQLERDGFLVLPDVVEPSFLGELTSAVEELFETEGDAAGAEFRQEPGCRRLANLIDKGQIFQRVVADERLLKYVRWVLGARFKLSSLNARSTNPRSESRQPLHADMASVPDDDGDWVCNCVWMLDDFTPTNGAMRVVPGSHRRGELPENVLGDPLAPHPDEVLVTGTAGTVVVVNSHTWHGGTENRTDAPRRAIHAFYARFDKPQQQYQKELLRPEVQGSLSPRLRELLALDDPLNDEVSCSPHKKSSFLK